MVAGNVGSWRSVVPTVYVVRNSTLSWILRSRHRFQGPVITWVQAATSRFPSSCVLATQLPTRSSSLLMTWENQWKMAQVLKPLPLM